MRTQYPAESTFPSPFQCYRPPSHKVYGAICMSPHNTILMVKGRATGKWSFPKGHKLRSENYQECARRETLEETGINLEAYKPMGYHKLSHGEYYFYELPYEIQPEPKDNTEVEDAQWMSVSEIRGSKVNVDVSYFLDRLRRGGRGIQTVQENVIVESAQEDPCIAPEN